MEIKYKYKTIIFWKNKQGLQIFARLETITTATKVTTLMKRIWHENKETIIRKNKDKEVWNCHSQFYDTR